MDPEVPLIHVQELRYRPVAAATDLLTGVSLDIDAGDFVLLLGPSGCGKSLLVRCLNGLIPHLEEGDMRGDVVVDGKNTREHPIFEFASILGMVFQNPDDQILSLKVVDEVAWGVENLGFPHETVVERVGTFMDVLGISALKDRLTFAISGGQKQKVAIAGNLAMLQKILVLDDPTTDLDPVCKAEVVQTLANLHKTHGQTLIVIEHDLNELIELANKVIVMDGGRVLYAGEPGALLAEHYDSLVQLGVNMPQHVEIAHAALKDHSATRLPTLKQDAFEILRARLASHHGQGQLPKREQARPVDSPVVLSVKDLHFAYDAKRPVLRGINFDVHQGEFLAIIGANGSGKSTLVNNMVGLLHPEHGAIVVNGHDTRTTKISQLVEDLGYVFQNPDHQLFANSVEKELAFGLRVRRVPEAEISDRVTATLQLLGLEGARERHPYSLSRGQRQKLAVGTALSHHPKVMLLDEPTTGQDRLSLAGLLEMMVSLNERGNTTVMVTHDMDIVAAYASRVIVMSQGQVVMDGRPEDIFYDHFGMLNELNLRPPTVVDFCRRLEDLGMPRLLTVQQLVAYLEALPQPDYEAERVAA